MCKMTDEKKWTLLKLLENYNVQIPKIQRDYAQGRNSDKIKKIRQKFLKNIYDALAKEDSEMNLEFVYGSTNEAKELFPLDGQQRLTTLFLLHWFGCVAGVREKGQLGLLRKFSYTTRHDAEVFCKLLTDDESFEKIKEEYDQSDKSKSRISDIIKNQPKFLSVYNSDPTASGMMVMLNAIQNKFQNAFEHLKNLDNINFYFLPLEKFELTDELYIKMNHRGKQLTEFEIFKAQIAENLPEPDRKEIMGLFDKKYTDYFWSMYEVTFDDKMLNFLHFAFFIDYYRDHDSFQDYVVDTDIVQKKTEEKHEETSPETIAEKKCFYDLFKEPEKNSVTGKEENNILSNSDRLAHYILQSYKKNSYGSAQDILTTFMSHTVKEDCQKFFCFEEKKEKSDYVELFNQTDKNLFIRACAFDSNPRNNPFPYAEQIFMFALYLYYKEQLDPDIFLKRFRTLRNLVRNSENVREEFLAKWLEISETIIKTGELASDLRGGRICSAEMYDYETGKSNLSGEDQNLLAEAENHPAIHGFAIGFISKANDSYSVKSDLLRYFLDIVNAEDKAAEIKQLKLLREALLVCCDFSAPYSKDIQNVRLIPYTENIEAWRYFTIPTTQRQKNQFFDALEMLKKEAGKDLEEWIQERLKVIPKNECYYFVKYADHIFPFGNYGYYCQGETNSANVLLLNSTRWGEDNIRWNMHLYIINKIWAAKTNKWFLQGNKDDAITLLNHSTVSLRSFDNHYRLTSGNEENLLSILPEDRENIELGKIENDGGCYCDLAIPQSNGVDAVDRIEFLFEKLNL